jgi:hypothetical protein
VEVLQSSLALVCWWFLLFSLLSLVNAIQEVVHVAPGLYGLVALFRALLLSALRHSHLFQEEERYVVEKQKNKPLVFEVD